MQVWEGAAMKRFTLPLFGGLLALVVSAGSGCSNPGTPSSSASIDSTGVQKASVTIDGGRYSPNVIEVQHGKPVELTFIGGKELGCGGTIVFKSLNQSKDVESGKSVTFTFTPNKAGEIPFTCGMGMYDGKVVVK